MSDPLATLPEGFTVDNADPRAALPSGFKIDTPVQPPGTFEALTDAAVKSATFGLAPHVAAAVDAQGALPHEFKRGINALATSLGYGEPFTIDPNEPGFRQLYGQSIDQQRQKAAAFTAQGPLAKTAATIASGLGAVSSISPGITAAGTALQTAPVAPTLGGRMLQGAKTGATIGTVVGVTDAPDLESIPKSGLVGGTVGAAVGAAAPAVVEKVISPIADMVARRFGSQAVDNQAFRTVADRVQRDASAGGPTAQDILDALKAGGQSPLAIADVGGQNVKGLGERIANTPGPGQQAIEATLRARDVGAGSRLADNVNASLGADTAFSTEQALMQARSAAAQPRYDQLQGMSGIWSPRLQQFLDDPVMKAGLRTGMELERIQSVTEGRPFNPTQMGIDLDAEGNVLLRDAPNMRVLDAGKKGLDAMIAGERNPITGRLSQRGVALDQFRRAYVGELDGLDTSGSYAAARAAWAGPSASLDALRAGQTVFGKHPEEIAAEFGRLSPSDQEFYRLGAADALKTNIARTTSGGNEARRIVGSQYTQNQLRPLFPSQDAYDRFIKAATDENTMFRTASETMGNSRTLRRAAEVGAASPEGVLPGALGQTIAGAMTGEPVVSSLGAFKAAQSLYRSAAGPTPEVDLQIARMLYSPDRTVQQQILTRLLNQQPAVPTSRLASALAAQLGGRTLPLLDAATGGGR